MPYTLTIAAAAPEFSLKGTDGKMHTLADYTKANVLVVFFTCNHCPYVISSDEITRQTAEKFKDRGVVFVGINSNCPTSYPADSYEGMVARMSKERFPWTYLQDPTQEIALKYGALRTPHFFVFDKERKLIYTGRGIDTPRDSSKMTVNDLEKALEDHLQKRAIRKPVTNPIGCNVKWAGHDGHWMPDDACDLQ